MGGDPFSLETLSHPNYRGLVDTLEAAAIDSLAYKNAILAYFEALIREQDERLDSLTRWLMGVNTTPEDTKRLREVGVTGKITRPNAFRMLRSLAQTIRALSYSGLMLLFDEVDRMASIGGKAEKLATDNLREVIDRCRDELPGAMFVYAVPPQFINDIVPRYPALQQRLRTPGRFSHANHFSPQISLEHLDLDENDLMLAIGEKLIPIYETAFDVDWTEDPVRQRRHPGQRGPRRLPGRQPPPALRQVLCHRTGPSARHRRTPPLPKKKPSPSSAARSMS